MNVADNYYGNIANSYEQERSKGLKWQREHETLHAALKASAATSVLDVPVGTGRFVSLYDSHGMAAIGMDISPDMLAQAREKALESGVAIDLCIGDVRAIALPDDSVDLVVCIRLLNWLPTCALPSVISELQRVSRNGVILSARHLTPLSSRSVVRPRTLARRTKHLLFGSIRRRQGSRIIYLHPRKQLLDAFAIAGLKVTNQTIIDASEGFTQYNIWQLHKAP